MKNAVAATSPQQVRVWTGSVRAVVRACLSLAAASAFANTATAADVSTTSGDSDLQEIVVSGQRLAQQRSIETKRNASRFIDSVSADDIGRLPDKNAAEALDRLAGISITVDQGEGRFVSIRGVNPALNNFTIDGVNAGSPEADGGGRQVPLDVIGSEMLSAIEVVKVHTPDMDAQGVGGTINVVRAGPFDYDQSLATSVSLQAGYDELNGKHPYSGEVTVSGLNTARTWGWLLSATHSYRSSEARGIYQDDWSEVESPTGETALVPENAKNNLYGLERQRTGASAMLEWRPSEGNRLFLRGFYSEFGEDEVRQRFEYFFRRNPETVMPDSGISTENRREQDLRTERKDKRFLNFSVGGENRLGSAWNLDYVAQINDNQQDEPNRNWEWRGSGYGPDAWSIDGNGFVDVQSGPVDPLDPSRLEFLRLRTQENVTDERGYVGGVNLKRSIGMGGPDSFIKFGARFTRTERRHNASQTTYSPGAIDWTLADSGQSGGAFMNDIDGVKRPNVLVDVAAASAFFEANATNPDFFVLDEAGTFEAQYQGDYQVDEQVLAGYAMADWDFGPLSLIAGVRIERTEVDSAGFELDLDRTNARPVAGSGRYTNVLPGLIARFDVTDELVLRAAWTNTLGRPNYEQIAPISALTREGSEGFLEVGNPGLAARESENLDLALEWYFARGGLLSLGAFRKTIENEIVSRRQVLDDFTYNGETFERFTLTTTQNAQRARVDGVELSYQQQFAFLPAPLDGLGVALSYASLDSSGHVPGRDDELPLARQPDWTRSGSLFYQKGGFELALTLSEADSYLAAISDAPETDLYAGEYGRLDLRASYAFREKYGVFLEWQNMNDEPTTEYQGGVRRQNTQYEVYGQTWYVGFSARL